MPTDVIPSTKQGRSELDPPPARARSSRARVARRPARSATRPEPRGKTPGRLADRPDAARDCTASMHQESRNRRRPGSTADEKSGVPPVPRSVRGAIETLEAAGNSGLLPERVTGWPACCSRTSEPRRPEDRTRLAVVTSPGCHSTWGRSRLTYNPPGRSAPAGIWRECPAAGGPVSWVNCVLARCPPKGSPASRGSP
jgi:hypothetical protein